MALLLPPELHTRDGEALDAALRLLDVADELVRTLEIHAQGRFGLSRGRLGVLLALDRAGTEGIRAADLAEQLRVSRPTVTMLLRGLTAEGLVARRPDPHDRRARRVVLSRSGQARVRAIAPTHARRLVALLRALDEDERSQLLALLEKLRGGLHALRSP
ncbi:MAG: MarR family transcriptional regulator [Deltaproteobacteria bacterium]|nr:MarR family transcriptional regulator [Deltaproteobacteria bacterium]